ncbi:TK/FER protein kinase [Aphelenchoides avenae]|nr:TK/FER protein kinase [Aphelenchus avenae]
MCMQAAWGIDYLHARKILHRDIAARNCLYGDGKVKISDFGLAREGTEFQMDPHNRVPIRWLAPETLRTAKYSQKTDVWAFGIMCWEIFNNGTEPYPGMTVAEVNYRIKQEQYRMPLPECAPAFMHTLLMAYCWAEAGDDRWGMGEIVSYMEKSTGLTQDPGAGSQERRRNTKKPRSEKTENYFA